MSSRLYNDKITTQLVSYLFIPFVATLIILVVSSTHVFSQANVFDEDRGDNSQDASDENGKSTNGDNSPDSSNENTITDNDLSKKWVEFKNGVTNGSLNMKILQSEDFRLILPQYNGSQPVFGRPNGGIVGETGGS
jgi:hypothetical protein